MANNSWMQVPSGFALIDGDFVPTDWGKILFNEVSGCAAAGGIDPARRCLRA